MLRLRSASIVLFSLLIALFVYSAPDAHADVGYVWYGDFTPEPGCIGPPDGGLGDYLCNSPDSVCKAVFDNQGSGDPVYMSVQPSDPGAAVFACNYDWIRWRAGYATRYCPAGSAGNVFVQAWCIVNGQPSQLGGTCCTSSPMAGEPINIYSGNMYEEKVDFRTSGINPMEFVRYYNSHGDHLGTTGIGWRHTFERNVEGLSVYYRLVRDNGREILFAQASNLPIWAPLDKDETLTLTVNSDNSFTVTDLDHTVEQYSSMGVLGSIAYRNGYTQTMNYDATTGYLTSVTDSQGRTMSFSYDTNGSLVTVTAPDGTQIKYNYVNLSTNAALHYFERCLTTVTYPASGGISAPTITYLHEFTPAPSFITGEIDELGNRIHSWSYDSYSRATQSTGAAGTDVATITYNVLMADTVANGAGTGTNTVTDETGQVVNYAYAPRPTGTNAPLIQREDRQASSNAPAASRIFTYDANNFFATVSDWNGNVTAYVNNAKGQPTSITEASGTSIARATTVTWDPTLDLPTRIVEPNLTVQLFYDTNGNLTRRVDTDNRASTQYYSTYGVTREWDYTYDTQGHPLSLTDPLGHRSTLAYDAHGNLSTFTDALGHATTVNSYNGRGLPLTITDANGTATTLTWDARGRLLSRTTPDSNGATVYTFTYDAAGNVASLALPGGGGFTYGYDANHRLIRITDQMGGYVSYTRNASGRITSATVTNGSTLVRARTAAYDSIGRLLQSAGAYGETTTYGYDGNGNALSVKNPMGNVWGQSFDALNRLVQDTDPYLYHGNYGYDAQGNLASAASKRNLTTQYAYNGFGQLIAQVSPDSGTTVFHRDAAGNITSRTDARNVTMTFTYDALNRLTARYSATDGKQNVTYAYDAGGASARALGRLTSYTDYYTGTTTLAHDGRGHVTSWTVAGDLYSGKSFTTSYVYDGEEIGTITYPSGHQVNYGRDANHRIIAVGFNKGSGVVTLVSGVTYLPFGPVTSFNLGNNLTSLRTYDQDYRITGYSTSGGVQNTTIGWSVADDVNNINDTLNSSRNQGFASDKLHRLITANSQPYGSTGYTYDADSNRAQATLNGAASNYTYATNSNQLNSITTGSATRHFTYDPAGNIITDDHGTSTKTQYTYNLRENRYDSFTRGTAYAFYYADGLELRTIKLANTTEATRYHYDLKGHLLAETDAYSGNLIREYVWMDDLPVAQIEANGTIYFIHTDHLGAPQKMTNTSRQIVWDKVEDPFGNQAYFMPTGVIENLRFPGQYYDVESGLNFNMNRNYDPSMGRYIETDPIGLRGGWNTFAYVGGNPLVKIDPKGLDSFFGVSTNSGGYNGIPTASLMQGYPQYPDPQEFGELASIWFGFVTLPIGAIDELLGLGTTKICEYAITKTVGNNLATRPFINSPLTIGEILSSGTGVADPGGLAGALRYDAQGTFNGSQGTYELVINPNNSTIYHFNFVGKR